MCNPCKSVDLFSNAILKEFVHLEFLIFGPGVSSEAVVIQSAIPGPRTHSSGLLGASLAPPWGLLGASCAGGLHIARP